jgi:hypothetical protein
VQEIIDARLASFTEALTKRADDSWINSVELASKVLNKEVGPEEAKAASDAR